MDEVLVTTVLFDGRYELLHDRIALEAIAPITEHDYEVGGATASLLTDRKMPAVSIHTAR